MSLKKRCVLCNCVIKEEFNKLKGTMIKVLENKKPRFIYVCSDCQMDSEYYQKAIIKEA